MPRDARSASPTEAASTSTRHRRSRPLLPRPHVAAHARIGAPRLGRGRRRVHRRRGRASPAVTARGGRREGGMSDVVSVELTAREAPWEFAPGRTIRGFTCNGTVPGPLVEANVGDELRVRLTNELPQPTTIHWHGVRVPAEMDGTEDMQRAVQPGETFEYRFVVPDAGTFWYHSHVNETEQLERGLYGALVVRGPGEPELDGEQVLLFDDLKLGDDGDVAPFGEHHELHEGREGDVLLVNGREQPELEIAAGQTERWRIVNAANTRFVRLSIGGRPFAILGTDGGLLPAPLEAREVLVTPGERVDLAVGPFSEG